MENANEEANAKVQHMPKRGPEREEERMEKTWHLREKGGGIPRTAETQDSRLKETILEGIWLIMNKHCKARAGQIKLNSLLDTQAELQNPKDQEKTLKTTRKTRQVIYNFSTEARLEDKSTTTCRLRKGRSQRRTQCAGKAVFKSPHRLFQTSHKTVPCRLWLKDYYRFWII